MDRSLAICAGFRVQLKQGKDRVAAPRAQVEDPKRAGRVERQVTVRRPQQVLPVGHVLIDADVFAEANISHARDSVKKI